MILRGDTEENRAVIIAWLEMKLPVEFRTKISPWWSAPPPKIFQVETTHPSWFEAEYRLAKDPE